MKIDKDTKLYCSFSSNPGNLGCKRFNNAFQKNGINAIYKSFRVTEETTADDIYLIIHTLNISGCAISMPLKNKIFKSDKIFHTSDQTDIMLYTQSINTIVNYSDEMDYLFNQSNLKGYNLDVFGILNYLKEKEFILNNQSNNVFVIGNGSFAKTAEFVFKKLGYDVFNKNSRDIDLNIKRSNVTENSIVFNASPRIISKEEIDPSIFFIDCNTSTESGKKMSFYTAREQYRLYGYDQNQFEEIE